MKFLVFEKTKTTSRYVIFIYFCLKKFPFLFGRKWTIIKADAARREIQRSESFSAADNQLPSAGPQEKWNVFFWWRNFPAFFFATCQPSTKESFFPETLKTRKFFNGILIQFHAHQISSFIIFMTGWRFFPFFFKKNFWLNSDIFWASYWTLRHFIALNIF